MTTGLYYKDPATSWKLKIRGEPYKETFDQFVEALINAKLLAGYDKQLCNGLLEQWRANVERGMK